MAETITGLDPDPRRKGAIRVMVDGKIFATIHEGGARLGLAIGMAWDEARAAAVSRLADEEGAWRALLVALERRSYGVAEIRRRLRQKGHVPEAVEHAVGRALQLELLDDAAFARNYVETRSERGRGPGRLRRDLMQLGVERGLIETAIGERWPEPEVALDMAQSIAERRARQLARLAPEVRRRRLTAYLARRGFTGRGVDEMVRRVLAGSGAA